MYRMIVTMYVKSKLQFTNELVSAIISFYLCAFEEENNETFCTRFEPNYVMAST